MFVCQVLSWDSSLWSEGPVVLHNIKEILRQEMFRLWFMIPDKPRPYIDNLLINQEYPIF